ncbi:hypothetical protein ACH5RR_038510 [Cinchona calisaya]|uniref:DUF4378 domain-containing protein n=1 Tax=Cinchona calisaya TaxID=153742 RepID=A0ABD2XYT2_9GENT
MLLKRIFWKRYDRQEIQRREPINQLVVQKISPPSVSPPVGSSEFYDEIGNDVVLGEDEDKLVNSNKLDVIVGGDDSVYASTSTGNSSSSSNAIKKWPIEEEKEQFSSVCVLDYPCDADDDEVSSPFQSTLTGTKKRLMKKIDRFERLTDHLKPLNLEEEENQESDKAIKLLDQLVKATILPSIISLECKPDDHDKLLLDFFWEGIREMELATSVNLDNELLNVANSWIIFRMGVQTNGAAYIPDMEREGTTWKGLINEEKQEVAMELEVEVFASLMNELLNDLL